MKHYQVQNKLGHDKMTTPKVAWVVRVNGSNKTKNLELDKNRSSIFHLLTYETNFILPPLVPHKAINVVDM